MLEDLNIEQLVNVVNEYISNNYDYDYADIFEDTIVYHLENGKCVNVYINLESERE